MLGAARNVVPISMISENRRIKSKLNTTSGAGYMEVKVNKVKTNKEVHIYVMLALQCMHDNLLKRHGFCWAQHAKWHPSVRIDEENPS